MASPWVSLSAKETGHARVVLASEANPAESAQHSSAPLVAERAHLGGAVRVRECPGCAREAEDRWGAPGGTAMALVSEGGEREELRRQDILLPGTEGLAATPR